MKDGNKPRQCIFCDGPATSKEHFWPQWMHGLLPEKMDNPKHDQRLYSYHPSNGETEQGPKAKPGSIHTIKIRAVCRDCNGGWMSQLEEESRPFLTALIEGTPIVLDHEQLGIVARWIALKCIVAEHANWTNYLTPRPDRVALREHGSIPDYFRIYLANHNLENAAGYIRYTKDLRIKAGPHDPPLMGAGCNVQTISFMLGRIMVHVNAARVADFDLESRYALLPFHQKCRIWPPQRDETVFPHRPLLDQAGVTMVSNCLEVLSGQQRHVWVEPTEGIIERL